MMHPQVGRRKVAEGFVGRFGFRIVPFGMVQWIRKAISQGKFLQGKFSQGNFRKAIFARQIFAHEFCTPCKKQFIFLFFYFLLCENFAECSKISHVLRKIHRAANWFLKGANCPIFSFVWNSLLEIWLLLKTCYFVACN